MMYLLCGDGGRVAENTLLGVRIAIVKWKERAADVHSQLVTFRNCGGAWTQVVSQDY